MYGGHAVTCMLLRERFLQAGLEKLTESKQEIEQERKERVTVVRRQNYFS
jgi:hypothetical protein